VVYQKGFKPILNRVGINEKYPEMVVEIGSHTDSRGNTQFNMNYGKRAQATRTISWNKQGNPFQTNFLQGYGETGPKKIKCIPEDSCTEEQHELKQT
jgi:outer membrane protein OmpA-like peptidoglycan-associated protein